MSLEREIEDNMAAIRRIVERFKERVATMPDNPAIKRLSPQAFVIQSKDLGNNWSPEFHDFKVQYRAIIAALDSGDPGDVFKRLRTMLDERKVRVQGRNHLTLHPTVLQYLKELVEKEAL